MTYVLTLLACLASNPAHCARYETQVQSCNAAGMGQVAMWAIEHPDWRVERFHCGEQET